MSAIEDLRRTIAALRAPDGCPWDREQTHASLTRCLIDEASELLDAIDRLDFAHMREELGDVLMQVVFHAQLAEESGHFDLEAVAAEANEKLIRRHPHVFGKEAKLGTSDAVLVKWDQIKAGEKKNGPQASGIFKRLPPRLPALMYAEAVWKQVGKASLPVGASVDKESIESMSKQLDQETLGRLLFVISAAARQRKLDPERALREEADRIKREIEARMRDRPGTLEAAGGDA